MVGEVLVFALVVPAQILALVLLGRAVLRRLRPPAPFPAQAPGAPAPLLPRPGGREEVPLRVAFAGLRFLPRVVLAANNAFPRLVLAPEGIETRVLRRRARSFAAVERVELERLGAGALLRFLFRGEVLTFEAGLGSLALARDVLRRLPPSVPLSAEAGRLRDSAG